MTKKYLEASNGQILREQTRLSLSQSQTGNDQKGVASQFGSQFPKLMIPGAAGAGAAMAKQSRWWTILPVCATELQSQPGNELSGDLTNTACGMVLCSTM